MKRQKTNLKHYISDFVISVDKKHFNIQTYMDAELDLGHEEILFCIFIKKTILSIVNYIILFYNIIHCGMLVLNHQILIRKTKYKLYSIRSKIMLVTI